MIFYYYIIKEIYIIFKILISKSKYFKMIFSLIYILNIKAINIIFLKVYFINIIIILKKYFKFFIK